MTMEEMRQQLRNHEVSLRAMAAELEQAGAGQHVDDPLPSAARDLWAAVRCCQGARTRLERVR